MINIKNINAIAQEVLNTCGGKTFLHIGSSDGQLVRVLLANGVDAHGFDESFETVTVANSSMPGRFIQGNVTKLPYADKTFDTIIIIYSFDHLRYFELIQAIKELKRVTRRSVYIRVNTLSPQRDNIKNNTNKSIFSRDDLENLFFNENFRKHPSYYLVNNYNELGCESEEAVILLECIPYAASNSYPLQAINEKHNLNIDMTRKTGEYSDASIARYQWASSFIRPGDTVLDAACGLGYGSYILQCGTMAAKTIGIDKSVYAIEYANTNFAADMSNLTFLVGFLPEALNSIPNNSIDVIISFETLEYILKPENILKEFHRILTPAGRLIVSVSNDCDDEAGGRANLLHRIHIYTLNKLRNQMRTFFDLESITVQSATRYKKTLGSKNWVPAKRELYEIDTNIDETIAPPSEWWLAVGMKSPINAEDILYRETQYKTFSHPGWNVTTFARDYKNPWLVRGIVDIGWRQKNKNVLNELIEKVININPTTYSADTGAALCVKGYQLLNAQQLISTNLLNKYVELVDEYIAGKSKAPHVIRWVVSLHFVTAKLWLQAGVHDKAYAAFKQCVKINPLQFSPLLANKTVEAYMYLGKLSLIVGDETSAREAWIAGITAAHRAVIADWQLSLGDLNAPAEFALPELSSILDYASNCAYALTNLDDFNAKPWWWLHLQRSPHSQFSLQKNQYESLKSQISLLDTFIISLKDEIHKTKIQLAEKTASIQTKERQLANLTDIINSKNIKIAEQAARLHEFNGIMQTRLINLRNIIRYQSWGKLKLSYIVYLTLSLVIPRALRKRLQLVTAWLRNFFHQHSPPIKTVSNNFYTLNVLYHVKKPTTKQGAPKVAHIIANFMIGGSSRLVVDLIEHLGHRYKQFILTSYAPIPPLYIGLDIEEQRSSHDIIPFIKYLKRKRPDFIHVHYWNDVDKNWYVQAIEAANVLGIPVIENINTPIEPYLSKIVKKYVYVSNYVRQVFGKVNSSHVTIYPGSDFSHFVRTDDEDVPTDCIGMVYRLEYDKLNKDSIKPFILIAQKRPKTKILIIGGGSLLSPFQQAVKNARLTKQFEFTGYVNYGTLPDYYRRMSIFISPVWQESFGQVSPFAMNMRIPVIGYDVGAISEIINSKEILAPNGDAEKLADIAIELLNNDKLRAKIGREHQQRAEKNFSIQAMIKAYAELYEQVVE